MRLPAPEPRYDMQNEAAMRRTLEAEMQKLQAQVAELSRQIETQRFGLSVTPQAQQAAIAAPAGGTTVDAEARTAIDEIRVNLQLFGFTA